MTLPESWYLDLAESAPLRLHQLRQAYAAGYMANKQLGVKSNDERGWKEMKARYWGLCTLVDRHVGRILNCLEEVGLAEDTIVVYTSDHGHMMGEHRLLNRSVQYEPSAQIPLIVRVPGLASRRLATPVSHVDLVPTLLDLLDQPIPKHLEGTSLVHLLADGDTAADEAEAVIEWSGLLDSEAVGAARYLRQDAGGSHVPARTIRRGRWKLTVYASGQHELYDLEADPGELHNANADSGSTDAILDLYGRLQQWQQETGDSVALPHPLPG